MVPIAWGRGDATGTALSIGKVNHHSMNAPPRPAVKIDSGILPQQHKVSTNEAADAPERQQSDISSFGEQ
jgi:hypothetical protein